MFGGNENGLNCYKLLKYSKNKWKWLMRVNINEIMIVIA